MRGVKKQDLPSKICVVCGRPFVWRKKWEKVWNEVRFCSERCRNVDLGAWATEGYRVAAQAPTEDPDVDPPPTRH